MVESILNALIYPFLFFTMYFQVFLVVTFLESRNKIKKEEKSNPAYLPSISVAIPCWNEEKTLAATLDSVISLDYPKDKLKIIVVDDGSTDRTLSIARIYESRYPELVSVIHKENGGKHTAMNLALTHSKSELFGCLDADSFVEPHTLKNIIIYFDQDKEVMAVTPCIQIKHPKSLIQRLQAVEYIMGVFLRKAYGELDAIQVTPGPFSIFRREVFERLGPYKKAHNTEDFEITLRMHKHHMKIANSHKATVYTVGPATILGYLKQHLRWARGFIENALDYREMFFKKEYGNFGIFTLPGAMVFIFYTMYTTFFLLYHFLDNLINKIIKWKTVGFDFPEFSINLFNIDTSMLAFISMILFTVFLFVLYIGRDLADDKQEFYKNFPVFFVLFPLLVPIYMIKAVLDVLFKAKNVWALQDTKKVNQSL